MRIGVLWLGICLAICLWAVGPLSAQDEQPKETLRVAVRHVEPFVFQNEGQYVGFSIDLWNEIAHHLDIETEWVAVGTAPDMITAVAEGDVDLGITNITITAEREKQVDFSRPMFTGGLQILTRSTVRDNFTATLQAIFSPTLLSGFAIALIVLLIVAHIVWFFERGVNPDFPDDYVHGVWQAFYWATVTATTIGYGDKVPRRTSGQVVALVWMLLSLFLVSYFTATVTTELTLHRLDGHVTGADDLKGHTVGTIRGSTSADYLIRRGIAFTAYEMVDEMITALSNHEIEAILYDAPVLKYAASQSSDHSLYLVEPMFHHEDYGIVLPDHTEFDEQINQVLLEMQEDGSYDVLVERWFGE